MKITSKLLVTIIIIDLIFMFAFELVYNRYLYDDKEEILQRIENLEKRK